MIRVQIDTKESIGATDLIETAGEDEIVYAKRVGRDIYSRFVKNKQPIPTSIITIDIRKENDTLSYYLYTTFIGGLTPSFPGGDFLPDQSVEFWSTHALVWGTQQDHSWHRNNNLSLVTKSFKVGIFRATICLYYERTDRQEPKQHSRGLFKPV